MVSKTTVPPVHPSSHQLPLLHNYLIIRFDYLRLDTTVFFHFKNHRVVYLSYLWAS